MPNLPEKKFSFKPSRGLFPFYEEIGNESKIVAYCDSEKMAKELIGRIMLLDSYQFFLESILESSVTGDDIREATRNRLMNPPDFAKPEKPWE